MTGPTQVAEIAHLPNVQLVVGRAVKFFLCSNGHIEPWLGEEDLATSAPRPCRICHRGMELTSRRIRKDGTLAVTTRKSGQKKPAGVVKAQSEKILLRRFARCLHHPYVEYVVEYPTPSMLRVRRKGDMPVRTGGRIYRRFVEVTIDTTTMRANIDLYGISGWFEDFRVAGKKCKLNPVATFYPALSVMVKCKTAKGGRHG